MLDDSSVFFDAEDIDSRPVPVLVSRPLLVTVQHDEAAFGNHALDSMLVGRAMFDQTRFAIRGSNSA